MTQDKIFKDLDQGIADLEKKVQENSKNKIFSIEKDADPKRLCVLKDARVLLREKKVKEPKRLLISIQLLLDNNSSADDVIAATRYITFLSDQYNIAGKKKRKNPYEEEDNLNNLKHRSRR